jgi:hypothetical protein
MTDQYKGKHKMENQETYSGTICAVDHYATVIVVFIAMPEGEAVGIPFDHRSFQHLLQCEGCSAIELIGRGAVFKGDQFLFTE